MTKRPPTYPQGRLQIPRRQQRPPLRQPTPQEMENYRRQAVRDLTERRCPDFDLAELKDYPRELLLRDPSAPEDSFRERLKRLTLTLALAFNDCKDLSWVFCQLSYGEPPEKKVSNYVGQWNGMRGFVVRTLVGFVGELVRALEKNRDLLDSTEFKEATTRIAPDFRWAWDELLQMVGSGNQGADDRAPVAKLTVNLRNKLSFHYASDKAYDDKCGGSRARTTRSSETRRTRRARPRSPRSATTWSAAASSSPMPLSSS